MIRTTHLPAIWIAVKHKHRHYYAVVLTGRQIMCGGQLVFALYHTSKRWRMPEQVSKLYTA